MDNLPYTKSYKYRVDEQREILLKDCPYIPEGAWINERISMTFAYLERRSLGVYLVLKKYYSWDGATWALDTKNFRKGSACHDALLEMIGRKLLPYEEWKPWTDNFLIEICKKDGMWWPRRQWVYTAVQRLGDPRGSKPRKVYYAP